MKAGVRDPGSGDEVSDIGPEGAEKSIIKRDAEEILKIIEGHRDQTYPFLSC